MKLQVLAGAMALSLGTAVLAPVMAQADDDWRGRRSDRSYGRSYRDDRSRSYRSSRSYRDDRYRSYSSRSYRDSRYSRSYRYGRSPRSYRSYPSYYYGDYYYGGYYAPYYRPPVVVAPAYGYGYGYRGYGYRGYRPLLGVGVAGPRFGVWVGF